MSSTRVKATVTTELATSEASAVRLLLSRHRIRGRNVLEVGGAAPIEEVIRSGAASWLSVDPANASARHNAVYETVAGSANGIPVDDESFDYVFSANAFEHIADLPGALREMRRVLRPSGMIYAHYGPIWSAPDGHHMEVTINEHEYRFWIEAILPPWLHLIVDEEEMREILAEHLPADHAQQIAAFCYRSPILNRLRFEDFLTAFVENRFSVRRLQEQSMADYPWRCLPFSHPVARWLGGMPSAAEASARYGLTGNITCRDMLVELEVS